MELSSTSSIFCVIPYEFNRKMQSSASEAKNNSIGNYQASEGCTHSYVRKYPLIKAKQESHFAIFVYQTVYQFIAVVVVIVVVVVVGE